MQASFEEVVRAWILDYDGRLPSERRERKEAFLVLLANLSTYGYGKEELNTGRKEKIIRSCVNPNHNNKKKLRTWISMVVNDLEDAILICYGNVKINRDVITPEMAAKLDGLEKRAEETKALRTADNGDSDDSDKPLDLEDKTVIDNFGNTVPLKSTLIDPKVRVTTDEELEQMNGPEVVWDTDLIEELGIKIYE